MVKGIYIGFILALMCAAIALIITNAAELGKKEKYINSHWLVKLATVLAVCAVIVGIVAFCAMGVNYIANDPCA